jgi:5-methylcytosine-specific restriction endonuclease McrA
MASIFDTSYGRDLSQEDFFDTTENTKNYYCKKCGTLCEQIAYDGPKHFAKAICPSCNSFVSWVSKPKNEGQRKKTGIKLKKYIPENMQGFCELCLRDKNTLKKLNLFFEIHHVIPVKDEGEDCTENLRLVCSQCHSLIHRHREIINRYKPHLES